MSLLPIGTIVLLDGGTKELMIYGKNVTNCDTNEDYDYVACLYPEGYIGDNYNVFFNHISIEKIIK